MTLETILVAVDFSKPSDIARAQALTIAERAGAALVFLWVEGEIARAPSGAAIYGTAVREVEAMVSEMRQHSITKLEQWSENARSRGVRASVRVDQGDPAETIVAVGEELDADLIVTGTKGLTGFRRFFLGSVATKVTRMSSTHVLVGRSDKTEFKRILVTTDFSPTSEKALALAVEVAAPGAEIEIFHAWQYPVGTVGVNTPNPTQGPLLELRNEIVAQNASKGAMLVAKYRKDGIECRFTQEHGTAAAIILERLEAGDYDLVAMGTHGYRGFQRFMLGSVAEATVRHSPCSVLVAHGRDS